MPVNVYINRHGNKNVQSYLPGLLTIIFDEDPGGFIQFDRMKAHSSRQVRFQFTPYSTREIFRTAHFSFHEFDIHIQVPVIHFFYDMFPDQLA